MAGVFNALGWIVVLIGTAWCALFIGEPAPDSAGAFVARLIMMAPGLSTIAGGLIFLAIGGVLYRLDRIVRSSADTADAVEDLLAHVKGQGQTE